MTIDPRQEQSPIPGIDFMRALACLMVLAHHLVLRLDVSRLPDELAPILTPMLAYVRFGNFGVAVFFVLSGFLLSRPFWAALDEGRPFPAPRSYAIRRAARILPGYLVALTAGFLLSITVFGEPLDTGLMTRFLAGLFLLSPLHWTTFFPVTVNGPLWSIPFEVASYLLLPLAFALLFRNRAPERRWRARLGWICGIAGVVALHALIVAVAPIGEDGRGWQYGMQGGAKEWMPRFNPVGFFAIFAIGALAAGFRRLLPSRPSGLSEGLALAALAILAASFVATARGSWEGYGLFGLPYGFPIFPMAVGLVLMLLPSAPETAARLDAAPIRAIATLSFGIYLWQDIVIHLIKHIAPWSFTGPYDNPLLLWLGSCAVAAAAIMVAAILSYRLVERPALRRARLFEERSYSSRS